MGVERLTQKSFIISSSGENTILAPKYGKLKLYSVVFETSADITGEVKIKLGNTIIGGSQSPKTGAMYGFNHNPNFVEGEMGDVLVVILPSATTVTVDVSWREAPSSRKP